MLSVQLRQRPVIPRTKHDNALSQAVSGISRATFESVCLIRPLTHPLIFNLTTTPPPSPRGPNSSSLVPDLCSPERTEADALIVRNMKLADKRLSETSSLGVPQLSRVVHILHFRSSHADLNGVHFVSRVFILA